MGAGYHGGFGNTYGANISNTAISLSPAFTGKDSDLKMAANKIKPEKGYTDIVIHGTEHYVSIKDDGNNNWINIDQRRLANWYKHNKDYKKGPIRLVSCNTGGKNSTFAQNLANKLGVEVKAPSDTAWIMPNGKIVIGPSPYKHTGKWVHYYPNKKPKG